MIFRGLGFESRDKVSFISARNFRARRTQQDFPRFNLFLCLCWFPHCLIWFPQNLLTRAKTSIFPYKDFPLSPTVAPPPRSYVRGTARGKGFPYPWGFFILTLVTDRIPSPFFSFHRTSGSASLRFARLPINAFQYTIKEKTLEFFDPRHDGFHRIA